MSFTPDGFPGSPQPEAHSQLLPRALSDADRETAAALVATAGLVNRAAVDRSFVALLESQGYDAEELQAGVTLQAAAEEMFALCQHALGELDHAQAAFDAAWMGAREDYVEFRWIVRGEYPDASLQDQLQVGGTMTNGMDEFIAQAAISYRAAQFLKSPERLARRGFSLDRVRTELAGLRRLARLNRALQARRTAAKRQREERDLAIAMLNVWMRDFERAARCALGEGAHPPAAGVSFRQRPSRSSRAARKIRGHGIPSRFRIIFPRSPFD